jgi:hypothetical protein
MQTRVFRLPDPGWLVTLLLCSVALWPLLQRPGLPNGDDVLYHVYRTAEMDRLWAQGTLTPRWAETFYTGYGAPVFHYYASFSYYVAAILMRVLSIDPVNALRGIIILCVGLSATGMYGFVRRLSGRLGGMLAAVTLVYSPYLLFTEPYSRGVYPELLAFALFPIILWSYSRLSESPAPGRWVVAAGLSALLVITHNLMALVLTGVLAAWLLWQLCFNRRQRGFGWGLVAVGAGVLLSAGFWVPVALEGSAVKLANLTGVAELNYRNFFVPFVDLFAGNPRLDGGAFNGLEHQLNLGPAQWMLALVSVLGTVILLLRRKVTGEAARALWVNASFFMLVALGCILLISTSGDALWSVITPLAYLQFPWRLLGPAVFALAILVGMNAQWITRLPQRMQVVFGTGMLLVIVGSAAPLLYIPEWIHATVDTSVAAYHQAEVQGLQRATTFSNEYLPAVVEVEPGPTPRLLADYADGYPVNKAHLEALPEGVTVESLLHTPERDRWRITTAEPFTFEVLTFAFLGWQARVDGVAVAVTPSSPHGLITLPIPAGTHEVEVYLGDTPARSLGALLSLVTAVVLVGVLVWGRRRTWAAVEAAAQQTDTHALWAGGAAFIIILVAMPVVLREGVAWVVSSPGEARLAQQQTDYRLNETLRLIGYDLNSTVFRPGERLELTVYWYASAPIPYGYASFVHISTGGPPVAQADKLNPAGIPTKTWPTTGFIQDTYSIVLPAAITPGTYQISVGLYTCDTLPVGACGNGERMQVTDGAGQPVGDAVLLAEITIP